MLYLASKSPRRKELLADAGVDFLCLENIIEVVELQHGECLFSELALKNAIMKAEANIELLVNDEDLLLASDTVLEFEKHIIGKPENIESAFRMLKRLAGKTHTVATAVAIMSKNRKFESVFIDFADVTFHSVDDNFIKKYVEDIHILDKAGSYALQESLSQQLIANVTGDNSTVIGLPMVKVLQTLQLC
ncbi:Maf family protein [Lentisphaerota bacterium WC36G]|nr:Maf family protein [Lentisphaerae bacterium WC36]